MNDDRLNRLKKIPVPPPSDKAKLAAVDAAMSAFDAAGEAQAAELAQDKTEEKSTADQGSPTGARPKTSFIAKAWSWFMDKRFISRPVAATLLILPVAGYVAVQFARDFQEPVAVESFGEIENALSMDKSSAPEPRALNEAKPAKPAAGARGRRRR